MKLKKESFIHSRLTFDDIEKDVLTSAYKIIDMARTANIHSSGAEDDYLLDRCNDILNGISELLDNYTNEYPDK